MSDEPQAPLRIQYVSIGPDGKLTHVTTEATPAGRVVRPPEPERPESKPDKRGAWRPGRLARRRG